MVLPENHPSIPAFQLPIGVPGSTCVRIHSAAARRHGAYESPAAGRRSAATGARDREESENRGGRDARDLWGGRQRRRKGEGGVEREVSTFQGSTVATAALSAAVHRNAATASHAVDRDCGGTPHPAGEPCRHRQREQRQSIDDRGPRASFDMAPAPVRYAMTSWPGQGNSSKCPRRTPSPDRAAYQVFTAPLTGSGDP